MTRREIKKLNTKENKKEVPLSEKKSLDKVSKEIIESSQVETVVPTPLERAAERCPYCEGKDFVKRGVRKNKHQDVQLYVCRNIECGRTFTSRNIKGKQFP